MRQDAVIVGAVRTPVGLYGGALAPVHPARLLGLVYGALLERAGLAAARVEQVVCGAETQTGEQADNMARTAWLAAGLPAGTAALTVDGRELSGQEAAHLTAALIGSGSLGIGLSCAVEAMSRVPPATATQRGPGLPRPAGWHVDLPGPFEAAERVAKAYGIGRAEAEEVAGLSRARARAARADGRTTAETCPVPLGTTEITADEGAAAGPRDRTPFVPRQRSSPAPGGSPAGAVHTARSTAPFADGAAGLLWASAASARRLGLRPLARIRAHVTLGVEPASYLEGPVAATRAVLDRAGLSLGDLGTIELDEPFAAVPLGWARALGTSLDRVNPRGGALALGRPGGATGARLLTTALAELHSGDHTFALATTVGDGAQTAATVLERL
ncbi:acetyl-CoA C-acyltransferase [Streptomyces sp. P6-2-1]|uniref:acetyl-CoA C-acyltransferase n=1 Tax=Streptomyces sp. P6-2-1 TaxID=3422591 RepID=UPI003D360E3F